MRRGDGNGRTRDGPVGTHVTGPVRRYERRFVRRYERRLTVDVELCMDANCNASLEPKRYSENTVAA